MRRAAGCGVRVRRLRDQCSARRGTAGGRRTHPWATLVLVPAVAIAAGTRCEWTQALDTFDFVLRPRHEAGGMAPTSGAAADTDTVASSDRSSREGIAVAADQVLEITFPQPLAVTGVALQAECGHAYLITGSSDGTRFEELWLAPPTCDQMSDLSMRRSGYIHTGRSVRSIRIAPYLGKGSYAVASLTVFHAAHTLPLSVVAPIVVWGLWLVCMALSRHASLGSLSGRVRRAWSRHDVWIAAAALYVVLFHLGSPAGFGAVAFAGLAACAAWVHVVAARRSVALLIATLALAALWPAAEHLLNRAVQRRVANIYDLTVDHRMRPDGSEINADGLRFRGTADDLSADDYVVFILGDSFTFGGHLSYEEAYPYVLERLLSGRCTRRVRVVNAGWVSSSPLLGLRLLRDIGAKYRPDLLVYTLDMTDFHDDLRYEEELLGRSAGGELHSIPLGQFVLRFVGLEQWGARWNRWYGVHRRPTTRDDRQPTRDDILNGARFFITQRPLAQSRPWIEAGVMRNLQAMFDLARDQLGIPMVLVIAPRAYQYSDRESPRNWEAMAYETLGPYALEPFRYFAEVAPRLPYPALSLLPAFQQATQFPLFLEDDPHWNAEGARLTARTVAAFLIERGLLPCAGGF